MRISRHLYPALAGALAVASAAAQTHYVKKPEKVVRAVGVYEWTGDIAKPVASRLIPVTLFIDGQLQDAGVYLARPVPMALETGTVFELDKAGVPEGTLDLAFSRHLEASDATGWTPYDDGWFGYGTYAELKKAAVASGKVRQSKAVVASSKPDTNRPHFAGQTPAPASGGSSTPAATPAPADPDRPTMKRAGDTSAGDRTSADASTPVASSSSTSKEDDDPDRPVLIRRPGSESDSDDGGSRASSDAGGSSHPASRGDSDATPDRPTLGRRPGQDSASSAGPDTTTPVDDPDRPTLKKRTPEEQKARRKGDESEVTGVGALNDDPNRPIIKRGKPAHALGEDDLPRLVGLPKDLHQMVAVSDAVNRPEHDFARAWESEEEHAKVLAALQEAARTRLKRYEEANQLVAHATLAPIVLADESLRGYTLSYGGMPTYVYAASSQLGDVVNYVTLVAQSDANDQLRVALSNVTDSKHLDRTPWFRLVDVVDAQASNRASLLFEERAQNSRNFALFRVLGEQAEPIFTTGTTQ